jgi:hypothetical protein
MGHGHTHEVAHFKRWCSNPDTCFCEVNRYVLAAVVGFLAATAELRIAWFWAGSYGAESDAGHAYADSGFILISAALAYWKHYDKENLHAIDDLGTWINSLFLILAGLYIFYRLGFGETSVTFAGSAMFGAGVVGLLGNYGQFLALGEKMSDDVDMHSSTRQHIFYDMLYSGSVMFAAAIVLIMDVETNFVWKCAIALLLVLIAAYLILKLVNHEIWEMGQWILYAISMIVAAVTVVALIINGSKTDVDLLTAILLAMAMIMGGLYNFYARYWKGGSGSHARDGHGHSGHSH